MGVIDGDGHITESTEQLAAYIDPAYREYGPQPGARGYFSTDGWDRSVRGTLGHSAGDAKTWLETMDQGGLEAAVFFPTHWDHEFPENIHQMRERKDLTDEVKHEILGGTARRLYGLNG